MMRFDNSIFNIGAAIILILCLAIGFKSHNSGNYHVKIINSRNIFNLGFLIIQ